MTFQTGHVGLNVSDLDRSKDFYLKIFGFEVFGESAEADRRYAFLGADGKLLLTLWQQSEGRFATGTPGLHHLSFQVPDIETVHRAETVIRELGATLHHDGVVPHGEGASSGGVFFEDPDGIRLEIFAPSGADERPAPTGAAPTCGFF
ncbi:VOC family protein [Streptosporangium roseum]|uniref:Glyoxalase/bleomycin resistance protein/dioxygenase n=1 Tax=Streptosporangium roseum (strain ATCC 12428 / DSM 43021 / JCM 3005 / KCTC 9067 / NCIMB 10171 / NRRL 2505 / NI 9100) TaxID=479432 RepID=D2BCY1_STRRD|nr:VOC family protein [Streptosporangium roseum]ACZ84222.1 glyoxalase/bleomycin resistance protein/dioxygenase [Streptosporangium roseum DSM 43021]